MKASECEKLAGEARQLLNNFRINNPASTFTTKQVASIFSLTLMYECLIAALISSN
jgi:hypothetical protein